MPPAPDIRILENPFDPAAEQAAFARHTGFPGGLASFTGYVRGKSDAGVVQSLHLSQYPRMTKGSIATCAAAAQERWPLDGLVIIHRVGRLLPGDPIVLVCTASKHRRAAFQACDYIMDHLKTRALFWKKEVTEAGEKWIEPRDEDYRDMERWE